MAEGLIWLTREKYEKLLAEASMMQACKEFGVERWEHYQEAMKFNEEMGNYRDVYEPSDHEE
jgi:hypothetical protein